MEYTTLGQTGRTVSRLGFGGAPAGLRDYLGDYDPARGSDREPVIAAIRRAVELGVSYFDTAAGYGNGASERIFGEALDGVRAVPWRPDEAGSREVPLFVATKVTLGTPEEVRGSIEDSLRRLRRNRLDLVQLHGTAYSPADDEAIFRKGGVLSVLEKAKEEGLTSHIGFTVEAINSATLRMISCRRFDSMQCAYNLIYQHPYDPYWRAGTMFEAEEAGLGIVTMRSLTSGVFQRWIQTVNPANTFDYTPSLLQTVLSNPLVDVSLVGMRAAAEVEQNVAICEDVRGRIDIEAVHAKYPTPNGRQERKR